MIRDTLLAYFHFLAIIFTAASLAIEAAICRPKMTTHAVRILSKVDLIYFGAAILVLVTGLARVYWGAKDSSFYLQNPVFYIKLGLFLTIGAVSIPPTLQFIRWSKEVKTSPGISVPDHEAQRAGRFIVVELILLAFLPLLASLMARGFGRLT